MDCAGESVNEEEDDDYNNEIMPDSQIYIDNLCDEYVPGIDSETNSPDVTQPDETLPDETQPDEASAP